MIDFEIMEHALKITWTGDASWKTILNYAVTQFGGIDFLICDYDIKALNLEQLPEFYRTVLCYWQEIPVYDQIISGIIAKFDWMERQFLLTNGIAKASSTSKICLMPTLIFCL